jgi:hypothetical protein
VRSREKITSEYSNEVSFAAQDEDNLTPLTAVVHHHGKLNEIRVLYFLSARENLTTNFSSDCAGRSASAILQPRNLYSNTNQEN